MTAEQSAAVDRAGLPVFRGMKVREPARQLSWDVRRHMTRLFLIVVMIAICLGAGATAGPAAFASELSWPLSEANLTASLALGTGWGVVGALVAAVALALADRKRLGITAVIAVAVTWLISFAGVWWVVVSSLG